VAEVMGWKLDADALAKIDHIISDCIHDQLWAPDLRNPSSHTRISPFVMAGDPCITETRIPTSSIHALRSERGLEVEEIIELFPGLSRASVVDAHQLEQRLRRERPLDRFAA